MKQHLEIEFKTMLTKKEYESILAALPFGKEIIQQNDYYDNKDGLLFMNKMMCRIRTIDSGYLFTLKTPKKVGVLEHEMTLESASLNNESLQIIEELLDTTNLQLIKIASSCTHRYEYNDTYGTWCLDYSVFDNHVDYELEYELFEDNEKAYPYFMDMLQMHNIVFEKSLPKYIRALNSSNSTLFQNQEK